MWVDDTSYASVMSSQRDAAGSSSLASISTATANTEPIRIASGEHGFELRPAGVSRGGRHFRLGSDGELETWDGIGFLCAARKIRLDVDLAALKSEDDAKRARRCPRGLGRPLPEPRRGAGGALAQVQRLARGLRSGAGPGATSGPLSRRLEG